MGFPKKILKFSKIADGSKFDVECNWSSMILKKFKIWVIQKTDGFFEKENWVFLKQAEDSQFDFECEWITGISQNVQKLGFFQKKLEFFKTHWWWHVCWRMQLALSDFSKNQTIWAVLEKNGFSEKILIFPKTAGGSNFAVKCKWNSKISKNVRIVGCLKKYMGSPKKFEIFETVKSMIFARRKTQSKMAVFSKRSEKLSFFQKLDTFSDYSSTFFKKAKGSN